METSRIRPGRMSLINSTLPTFQRNSMRAGKKGFYGWNSSPAPIPSGIFPDAGGRRRRRELLGWSRWDNGNSTMLDSFRDIQRMVKNSWERRGWDSGRGRNKIQGMWGWKGFPHPFPFGREFRHSSGIPDGFHLEYP